MVFRRRINDASVQMKSGIQCLRYVCNYFYSRGVLSQLDIANMFPLNSCFFSKFQLRPPGFNASVPDLFA